MMQVSQRYADISPSATLMVVVVVVVVHIHTYINRRLNLVAAA